MTLHALRSKDRMSRREFLKVIRSKEDGIPVIDKEKCTGCGLCAMGCPTKALAISQNSENEIYQLLFREEACTVCGVCETSCPEHCLRIEPLKSEKKGTEAAVLFEDRISHCGQCGFPLFPQAMIRHLNSKIFGTKDPAWSFNLCPSCSIKAQLQKEVTEKIEI